MSTTTQTTKTFQDYALQANPNQLTATLADFFKEVSVEKVSLVKNKSGKLRIHVRSGKLFWTIGFGPSVGGENISHADAKKVMERTDLLVIANISEAGRPYLRFCIMGEGAEVLESIDATAFAKSA